MLNCTEAHALLVLYQAMLRTAQDNDWDALDRLQHEAATLRDATQALAPSRPPLSQDEQETLAGLLRQILQLDEQIRAHAEPALESTRKMLAGTVRSRNVHSAYGKTGG